MEKLEGHFTALFQAKGLHLRGGDACK